MSLALMDFESSLLLSEKLTTEPCREPVESHVSKVHFNMILPSVHNCPMCSLLLKFSDQNFAWRVSFLPFVLHVLHLIHPDVHTSKVWSEQ